MKHGNRPRELILLAVLWFAVAAQSGATDKPSLRTTIDPKDSDRIEKQMQLFLPENRSKLLHIPDYDVLQLAFPPDLWKLIPFGRDAYLASLDRLPVHVRHLVLLLGLGEYIHDDSSEGLSVYFGSPSGTLAPEVLAALHEAGLNARAEIFANAIAAFGPNYPVIDKDRSNFFARRSFLRVQEGIVPDPSAPPTAVEQRLRELVAISETRHCFAMNSPPMCIGISTCLRRSIGRGKILVTRRVWHI